MVAVEGWKFKASASKASMVSAEQVAKQWAKIEARIAEYLQQLDPADRHTDGEGEPDPKRIEVALRRLRAMKRSNRQKSSWRLQLRRRERPHGWA